MVKKLLLRATAFIQTRVLSSAVASTSADAQYCLVAPSREEKVAERIEYVKRKLEDDTSFRVPSRPLTPTDWRNLLDFDDLPSFQRVDNHLYFLAVTDLRRSWSQTQKQQLGVVHGEDDEDRRHVFGDGFRRRRLLFRMHRGINACLHGPQVVIDAGFLSLLKATDRRLSMNQINFCVEKNMKSVYPCNLTVANIDYNHSYNSYLSSLPCLKLQDDFPNLTFTSQDYMDLYDRESLVYLSPDSPNVAPPLLDPSRVYVIAALVDKFTSCSNFTFNKAQAQGIETMRLPLENIINGDPLLPINTVLRLLLNNLTRSQCWETNIRKSLMPTRLLLTQSEEIGKLRQSDQVVLKQGYLQDLITGLRLQPDVLQARKRAARKARKKYLKEREAEEHRRGIVQTSSECPQGDNGLEKIM